MVKLGQKTVLLPAYLTHQLAYAQKTNKKLLRNETTVFRKLKLPKVAYHV